MLMVSGFLGYSAIRLFGLLGYPAYSALRRIRLFGFSNIVIHVVIAIVIKIN